ncbi:MAG: hypothetical protein GX587_12870 [Bacteroidales bacterium]|nr:hypothetical protein [Bacteroidales bacterium]
MKNLIKNSCLLLVFFSIFIACDNNSEVDDYRYKFAGAYDFVTISRKFSMLDSTCNIDTFSYQGRVYFSDTLANNEIVIQYLQHKSPLLTVDEQGLISDPGYYNNNFGEFIGDSAVSLFFSWGGHGGGGSQSVEGKKR